MKTKEFTNWLFERGFQSYGYQEVSFQIVPVKIYKRGDLEVSILIRMILPDRAIINGEKFKFDDAAAYLGSLLHAHPVEESFLANSICEANNALASQTSNAINKMINADSDPDITRKLEQLRKALEGLE